MTKKEAISILQLSSKYTEAEIKKAFRTLSLKYHPDKNNSNEAKEIFQKINEANQILTGKIKERTPVKTNKQSYYNPFNQRNKRIVDTNITVEFTESEYHNGCIKLISFNKKVKCDICNGIGGYNPQRCNICHGSGTIADPLYIFIKDKRNACTECSGAGYKVTDICKSCGGQGVYLQKTEFNLTFKPSNVVQDYILEGQGDFSRGYKYSDLIITPKIKEEEQKTIMLSFSDLINGCKHDIHHEGRIVKIKIAPGTEAGKLLRIKELSLIVKVAIILPAKTRLTEREKEIIDIIEKEKLFR